MVRKVGAVSIKIWQAMLFGAIAVLITGQISIVDAVVSINLDVMAFLFCMFIIGVAMEKSGYLSNISNYFFGRARTTNHLVFFILFIMGLLSALLMNDTLAIIGTPIVLGIAKKYQLSPKLLLITLAFAVTTGSVLSPIGNPQNLLVATQGGFENPFMTFLQYLFIPTIICLLLAFLVLRLLYRTQFRVIEPIQNESTTYDSKLTLLSKVSLILVLSLIVLKILFLFLFPSFDFKLPYIAVISCLPILLFSSRRIEIIRSIDWSTLVFFAAMFILMTSVWNSGFIQYLLEDYTSMISTVPVILTLSLLLSQILSNVPLVALYIPLLNEVSSSAVSYVALAAGSTIAGNMLVLGAASNVIIIQNAENNGETITFWEFARAGIPLTILQALVYLLFLI